MTQQELRCCTRDKVSDDGVPRRSVMISNWCTTFFPGKSGLPVRSSANMHPILQISIAGVYCIKNKMSEYFAKRFENKILSKQTLVLQLSAELTTKNCEFEILFISIQRKYCFGCNCWDKFPGVLYVGFVRLADETV
jgi:hypothetical protein